MLPLIFVAAAAASAPPTPVQYYSQALARMQRLVEPAYVAMKTHVTAQGMGIAPPCDAGKILWSFGFGKQMRNAMSWRALYRSADKRETIRLKTGAVCSGHAATFDRPTWTDAYDWVRYGIFNTSQRDAAPANDKMPEPPRTPPMLKTIAVTSAMAPAAYRVTDGGPGRCPSGSAGHVLHLSPRFDANRHPLRDAVVETATMRICSIRFDLGSYQAIGTGFRGDMRLDFGQAGENWIITRGHVAMALRAAGLSLKSAVYDFWYTNVGFPATPPEGFTAP